MVRKNIFNFLFVLLAVGALIIPTTAKSQDVGILVENNRPTPDRSPNSPPTPTSIKGVKGGASASVDTCDDLTGKFTKGGEADLAKDLKKYCSYSSAYNSIVKILYYLAGIAAVLALIYGGFLYMTARGDSAQLAQAKKIIIWTLVGIVLVVMAVVIVNSTARFLQK